MNAKNFALVGGIVMIVVGALALIPAFTGLSFGLPLLHLETSYGLFLGFLPMNIINKVLLIALGMWGVAAASDPVLAMTRSLTYSKSIFAIAAILTVLGLFSETNTLFGYVPLFGASVWLHGVMALMGGLFGYVPTTSSAKTY